MCNAYVWRWLLLLAGLGAISGCARLTEPDFRIPAQIPALEAGWAKMPNESDVAAVPASVTAPRGQAIIPTSAIPTSAAQPAAPPPASSATGATTRRSLWDKQPWEVELDNLVRSICRGC
jgi:hypothetical protein